MATIFIPSALRRYTEGREQVEVEGGVSLRRVIENLNAQFPGLRDELVVDGGIRPGIAVFIDDEMTTEGLVQHVPEDGRVHLLPALGGG